MNKCTKMFVAPEKECCIRVFLMNFSMFNFSWRWMRLIDLSVYMVGVIGLSWIEKWSGWVVLRVYGIDVLCQINPVWEDVDRLR